MRPIDADVVFPWYKNTFKDIEPNDVRFSMLDIRDNLYNIQPIEIPRLDKIRDEIEELDGRYVIGDYAIYGENIPKYVKLLDVLQIIDKYKAESEVENGE